VLLARLEEDTVAGADDRDRAASVLGEADALRDVDRQAVRAPGVKWTLLAFTRDEPAGAATESM
jgi:hypothetical protein